MRQTAMQRRANRATGVNYTNPGQVQARTNAHARGFAAAFGGRVRRTANGIVVTGS